MKNINFFILISILSIYSSSFYAQEANRRLLDTLVEKKVLTETEAEAIMKESREDSLNRSSFENRIKKVREAFNTPYIKFGGYGMLLYKYEEYAKTHSTIKPRVFYLSMNGQLTKTLSYSILYEAISPTLTDFFLQWSPRRIATFRLGQFKVPFTLENQLSLSVLETIEFTRSISSLAGMNDDVLKLQNGKNNGGRDIGAQISGALFTIEDYDLVEYKIGIFQGAGIVSSAYNNNREFAGTILIQPIRNLRVGVGVDYSEATYADPASKIEFGNHVRNRWAISANYKSDRLLARTEWLHGNDAGIRKEGLYGIVNYYWIPQKLSTLINVDYYNSNKDFRKEVVDYTAGINYFFYEKCRFQVNYTYSNYSKRWDAPNSNRVTAQMQIVF